MIIMDSSLATKLVYAYFFIALVLGICLLFSSGQLQINQAVRTSRFTAAGLKTSPKLTLIKTTSKPEKVPKQRRAKLCSVDAIINQMIQTSDGSQKYSKIYEEVYGPLNYTIRPITARECEHLNRSLTALLPLDMKHRPSCTATFNEWLHISNEQTHQIPPKNVTKSVKHQYTLFGYVSWRKHYMNEVVKTQLRFTRQGFNRYFNALRQGDEQTEQTFPYKNEDLAMVHAIQNMSVKNARVAVIGTMNPWVEATLLHEGVRHITTVEYGDVVLEHENIKVVHPRQLASKWNVTKPFEFIFTFSSLEHSGLGRYGDPIDPWGDIAEMAKLRCMLKDDGLLVIGLPTGGDRVVFNLHRVYGMIRLPLMFAGFEVLATYHGSTEAGKSWPDMQQVVQRTAMSHVVFVLRKVTDNL